MLKYNMACFILCHGRPERTPTYNSLLRSNYTGDIYIILDDEDETVPEYKKMFGEDKCLVFSKKEIRKRIDTMDSSDNMACAVYARNACYDFAKELGIDYFVELDDDYKSFYFRFPDKSNKTLYSRRVKDLDEVFNAYIDFMQCYDKFILGFAQGGGDYFGGVGSALMVNGYRRKVMNSWICKTAYPVQFNGRMNDDVNTYTLNSTRGYLFMTLPKVAITQPETQLVKGGMTEMYKGDGTYMKSFYTVMCAPSCAKINMMGQSSYRIHHNILWQYCAPKIISGRYKKEE